MDRLCLCGLFLVPPRAYDRLYAAPAGLPHAGLHRRIPRAGGAGAGDFQGGLKRFPFSVVAGLVPAIHVFSSYHTKEDVDARHRRQVYAVCARQTAMGGMTKRGDDAPIITEIARSAR